jgi:hypothetical protein
VLNLEILLPEFMWPVTNYHLIVSTSIYYIPFVSYHDYLNSRPM